MYAQAKVMFFSVLRPRAGMLSAPFSKKQTMHFCMTTI
jgi:hypothetical protein